MDINFSDVFKATTEDLKAFVKRMEETVIDPQTWGLCQRHQLDGESSKDYHAAVAELEARK